MDNMSLSRHDKLLKLSEWQWWRHVPAFMSRLDLDDQGDLVIDDLFYHFQKEEQNRRDCATKTPDFQNEVCSGDEQEVSTENPASELQSPTSIPKSCNTTNTLQPVPQNKNVDFQSPISNFESPPEPPRLINMSQTEGSGSIEDVQGFFRTCLIIAEHFRLVANNGGILLIDAPVARTLINTLGNGDFEARQKAFYSVEKLLHKDDARRYEMTTYPFDLDTKADAMLLLREGHRCLQAMGKESKI